MVKVKDIFKLHSGNGYYLCNMNKQEDGVNFIAMSAKNNGATSRVAINGTNPFPEGLITVAMQGSILSTFVQPEPFYTSLHVAVLEPKHAMTLQEKLYYCMCIKQNIYKYNYGRKANKTFKNLNLPSKEEIPSWVHSTPIPDFTDIQKSIINQPIPDLYFREWKTFRYGELFKIKKGQRLTSQEMKLGVTPYIGATAKNNGITSYIDREPIHQGNTITVNYDGSIGEAFYQETPFWCSDAVNVLYPNFTMNSYHAMFIITLIRKERYRFNFGRKWGLERMNQSIMKLPVNSMGNPDWDFMENYIKSLKYSSNLSD